MAATIDPTSLEAWSHLASSAMRLIDTSGLMNVYHKVGVKEKEVATYLAQQAYVAITPLYDEILNNYDPDNADSDERKDIGALKTLLENLTVKTMTGALDDMHEFLK